MGGGGGMDLDEGYLSSAKYPHLKRRSPLMRQKTRKLNRTKRVEAKVKCYSDIVWQENPDRILKYRPYHLHYYGWIPFIVSRNLKATVFSEVYIHVQSLILFAWVLLLHTTGLGIGRGDMESFVKMFGTIYAGAIFNVAMVITFILGLFTTLVINRWSGIRAAYSKILGTTIDLSMTIAHVIHNEMDWNDKRTLRARTELTRLLNLGHLLVITKADAQTQHFKRSKGVKTLYKSFKKSVRSLSFSPNSGSNGSEDMMDGDETVWEKKARYFSYHDLLNEGLVNPDEWALLRAAEKDGMPDYQTVYYWAQALLHKCKAAEWIINGPQVLPILLNKVNAAVESGSQILNTINSQMPYPYVHLVSFVVHTYLFVMSTWFGCFLFTGYPEGETFKVAQTDGGLTELAKDDRSMSGNWWTIVWCYVFVMLANIMFQGLLDMHTLLDNPFGGHVAMFPLRNHISKVLNATRTMLNRADKLPAAFRDVFTLPNESDTFEDDGDPDAQKSIERKSTALRSQNSAFATFLNPQGGEGKLSRGGSLASIAGMFDTVPPVRITVDKGEGDFLDLPGTVHSPGREIPLQDVVVGRPNNHLNPIGSHEI